MTPQQKIKWAIINQAYLRAKYALPCVTKDNVDELYDELDDDEKQDALYDVRGGNFETGLPCESSRYYESKSVAMKMPDDTWAGWTFWYGGGKHGEPSSVGWMEDAYDLTCKEEEKLVIVREFTK